MLEFIEVPLGRGGSPSCGRCARSEAADYRQAFDITAEVEAACAAWGAVPGPNVALTGPEPFGHPELPQLLASTVRAGVKRLRLDTDAVALGDPGAAEAVLAAGVRHIRVRMLGGPPGVHDELAGAPGAQERSLQGMRAFAEAARRADVRVAVSAHVSVCRHNLQDLPAAVTAAVEAGARHVLAEVADPTLDVRASMPWLAAACDSGTVNCAWVELAGVPYCLGGDHALHLVPLLRPPVVPLARGERCAPCRLGDVCGGLHPEAAPQVRAALAPPANEELLAESIRRAYLSPGGPGEGE
jgi:hypothetical protein